VAISVVDWDPDPVDHNELALWIRIDPINAELWILILTFYQRFEEILRKKLNIL
jgi:hypothetical protein